jgi:hypothetical protein
MSNLIPSSVAGEVKPDVIRQVGAANESKWIYKLAARCFGGPFVEESVVTKVWIEGSPEAVWKCLMTYEEIPVRAPLLLRWVLPQPIGTSGDKTKQGEQVPCRYVEGGLVKQIRTVRPPSELTFDVVDQHLGVEDCVVALGGSYEIEAEGKGSQAALSTRYVGKLHPRFLWRPVERFLAHQLHRHVLSGMKASMRGQK